MLQQQQQIQIKIQIVATVGHGDEYLRKSRRKIYDIWILERPILVISVAQNFLSIVDYRLSTVDLVSRLTDFSQLVKPSNTLTLPPNPNP